MTQAPVIVGLGEALFDLLPGGKVLGGAPLNAACHVHQLLEHRGGCGIVASRVGVDHLGDEILASLASRGMTSAYVQRDPAHATSTVSVALEGGQPTYTFAPDIAWDHLDFTADWKSLARQCTAVCFGTLAQRSTTSRRAIWQFLDLAASARRMFDVNLRLSFYDRESIVEGCRRASIVKLNDAELPILADLLQLLPGESLDQLAELRARFELEFVVYTRGPRGTMLVLADHVVDPPAVSYPPTTDADAVGAGDACAAGILVGCELGLEPPRIAELANHLGAYVAAQAGGTPRLPVHLFDHFFE